MLGNFKGYTVSSNGTVYSKKNGEEMETTVQNKIYLDVQGGISMFDILAAACAAGLGALIMLVILSITDHLQ